MKRPRRRATGKGAAPRKRPADAPFPKPRQRPRTLRPLLGLPRNHADTPIEPRQITPPRRSALAAIGFCGVLGLALAVRAATGEAQRQLGDDAAAWALVSGAIAVGIAIQLALRRCSAIDGPRSARERELDAAGFTALAAVVAGLAGLVVATEYIRATVTTSWDFPPPLRLWLTLLPLVLVLTLSAAVAAQVARTASAWYHAAGVRVLIAVTLAAVAGSVTPLGRQGVLIVAPLALFLAAFIVLVRHPATGASAEAGNPLPRRAAPAGLVIGAVLLLVSAGRAWPGVDSFSSQTPLPDVVAQRWEVSQTLPSRAAIAASDLLDVDSPTLLVVGGADLLDAEAPLLASRLARAARRCGRVLFLQPCSERLIRRVRRDLRRGGELPAAYLLHYGAGAQAASFVAVGFDVPAWLDARPLPAELHLTVEPHEAAAPRADE